MTVKSILLLPLGSDTDESTFVCGLLMARRFGAHIAVAHVRELPIPPGQFGFDAIDGYVSESLVTQLQDRQQTREAEVRQRFDDFVTREDLPVVTGPELLDHVSVSFEVVGGRASDFVSRHGGAYDLIVVGRPHDGGVSPASLALETALFATGRPILIAPPEAPAKLGESVMIGWNRSAPSARAFHAAKTLILEEARKIRLLSVATGAKHGATSQEIADNLAWHGIAVEVRELEPDYRSIGEVLLLEASAVGADLLVMGAYSHNRFRQLILGGVTRYVIDQATIPVFMAH